MKKLFLGCLVGVLGSCATTYESPTGAEMVAESYTFAYEGSASSMIEKAKKSLALSGYQIRLIDSGLISTEYKFVRLTPAQADCGKTFGLDYLKDKRTKTEVAYTVLVEPALVTVKVDVRGEYKPGAVTQDVTLTCVSRGELERELISALGS